MTVTYKVLVIRQESPRRALIGGSSAAPDPEVLFEAGGPDAGRLLAYAPAEVAAALTAAGYAEVPQRVTGLIDTEALDKVPAADEPDVPVVNPPEPQPAADAPKPRKRRTKAQIEADNAAALVSQQGADPSPANEAAIVEAAAPAEAPPAPPGGVAVTTAFESAQPAPAPAPDQPWNPFAK